MEMNLEITRATVFDTENILALLKAHHLPTGDIETSNITFYVILEDSRLLACAGIEEFGDVGLLRSVAVQEEQRGKGVGRKLIDLVLLKAKKSGIKELYLLTETAEGFFERKGFSKLGRELAPEHIETSSEFAEVCPASAVFMKKEL